ncbi:MAG: hypothetical protein QNI99_06995 [Woeseiaceae bacterium]|nr:hypothetical protein [Woeseiaceae bacterium]
MIAHQLALLKREFWEHRSIWITPVAVAIVMVLVVTAIIIAVAVIGQTHHPEVERLADATLPEEYRRAGFAVFLLVFSTVFIAAMWFVVIFYSLDSLYAERRDRSILFWRSLPITDSETVVSKLLTAVLAIPIATMAVIMVSHLVWLILLSIWLGIEGANPFRFVWGAVPLFETWAALFILLLAIPIWFAPLLGWFLFISAWAKRGPLLRAALPIAILPILAYIVFRTWDLAFAILERLSFVALPIYNISDFAERVDDDNLVKILAEAGGNPTAVLDLGKFFTSIEVWAGMVICGLFVTSAIYVRRFKDDS